MDKTRSKGNEFIIDPLINLYKTTKSEKSRRGKAISGKADNLFLIYVFGDIEMIKNWFSVELRIDAGDHLNNVVEAACNGNYSNYEHYSYVGPPRNVFNASTLLQEQIHDSQSILKNYYLLCILLQKM